MTASQLRDRGFEPYSSHDHDSTYDTSASKIKEADLSDKYKLQELVSKLS
jgi:hypothetical protein